MNKMSERINNILYETNNQIKYLITELLNERTKFERQSKIFKQSLESSRKCSNIYTYGFISLLVVCLIEFFSIVYLIVSGQSHPKQQEDSASKDIAEVQHQ